MLGSVKKAVFRVLCLGTLCLCGGLMAEQDPKELIFSGITIYTDKNFTRAKKYFEKACKSNDAEKCKKLAEFYFKANDLKKTLKYYSKACKSNDADGCAILGDIYHNGVGVTKDFKKAFEYSAKACELNDAKGCYALAALNEAKGVARDEKQMTESLKKACELGLKEACDILKEQKQ
ncbi:sel1 repeat family protein [Helicobacter pylori]|uniref:tetratricopeptide repeat protein n=1 Tax=Helicobacter pylori TaxID=210 RepID=UPI000D3B2773|nr:tetratricopeptide repeat protein [Helicobacter pylori]PUD68006.1 sel1 repeat family protein [Helicobacter pylori]